MIIRQEESIDYNSIYKFVKTAFSTAKVTDVKEQDFVNNIRNSENYIPELSLIAEENGDIIGYAMLSKILVKNEISDFEGLFFAPLCTDIKYRCKGLGSKIMLYSLDKARKLGYKAVFLVGDYNYYSRFGFEPTVKYGIKWSYDIPEEYVMVLELKEDALNGVTGVINF